MGKKMRKTTLYTIEAQEVMAGDYVEFVKCGRMPAPEFFRQAENELITPVEFVRERWPVEHVWRVRDGVRTDQFIAMSRELREILNAPFLERLNSAVAARESAEWKYRELAKDARQFWDRPWYLRVLSALKGVKQC